MFLKSLFLKNFRCFEEATFEFSPKVNLFHGENARGKTTLLEAIYFLTTGRSFRGKPREMIRHGMTSFYLELRFEKFGLDQKIELSYSPKQCQIRYNATVLQSLNELIGIIPVVVMTPQDLEIINGSPDIRRHFLDLQLAQQDPLYIHHLRRYFGCLKRRNALLRQQISHTMDVWEEQMGLSWHYISKKREKVLTDLSERSGPFLDRISSMEDTLALKYTGKIMTREKIQKNLKNNRPQEFRLGYTLQGPHREDFSIRVQEQPVKRYASLGQKRSVALSLRFAEWRGLSEETETEALMMIDDVKTFLDPNRQERLLQNLSHCNQVFLTSAEKLVREYHTISL